MARPDPLFAAAILTFGVLLGGVVTLKSWNADERAPDFSLTTIDNETFALADHRGGVVVVDFFATWCASCKITEAELLAAWPDWNGTRVAVLSIDVDPFETDDMLRAYREEHSIPWAIARDTAGVSDDYGVWELGHLTVVDPEGRVVYVKKGAADSGDVTEAVAAALSGRAPGVGIPRVGLAGLAVLAGVASFFSPCAIALLPAYVTLSAAPGVGADSRARVLRARALQGTTAAGGLLLAFLGAGGFLIAFGSVARDWIPLLQPVVGLALVALGAAFIVQPGLFAWASRFPQLLGTAEGGGGPTWRHFSYGIGYGGASVGCTLPVLLQLGLAASLAGPVEGSLTIVVYAASAALLLVGFTVASVFLPQRLLQSIARGGRWMPVAAGAVFVLAGAYLVYYYWRAFGQGWTG